MLLHKKKVLPVNWIELKASFFAVSVFSLMLFAAEK